MLSIVDKLWSFFTLKTSKAVLLPFQTSFYTFKNEFVYYQSPFLFL